MKKTVAILFLLFSISIFAQENQTSKKDVVLLLNTKVTIQIDSRKSVENPAYSIVKVEAFEKILEKSDIETIKNSKGEPETIVFYLCQEKDKASKYNTLLIRNFSKFAYQFKTEIQIEKDGIFLKFIDSNVHGSGFESVKWTKKTEALKIIKII